MMQFAERPAKVNVDSPPRSTRGPHLGILALISLGIFAASLITSAIMTGGHTYVSPFSATGQVTKFFHENAAATRLTGMLQFGSAVPLGIYAATAYARLLRLGVRVPGPGIGFFGGAGAAILLMLSATVTWVLGHPEITADPTLTHALSFLSFMTGGVGFVTCIGLLIAGIAVPALILRLVPRWLALAGLVVAALAELTFLSMTIQPVQYLLPIGRFGGLVWLIAIGFLLPHHRAAANSVPAR